MNPIVNFFTPEYPPQVGGIASFTYRLGKEINKQLKIKVNVITSRNKGEEFESVFENTKVFRLSVVRLIGGRFPVPINILEWWKVYLDCCSGKRGVNILQTRFFATSLIGAIMAWVSDMQAIAIEHGSGHFEYGNRWINMSSAGYEHAMTWILKNFFGVKFFGTAAAPEEFLRHFRLPIEGRISNGVDRNIAKCVDLTQWKNAKLTKFNLVSYAGRLIKEKGIVELIDAFSVFVKRNPRYVLVLCGSGELESYVEGAAKQYKWLKYLGPISRNNSLGIIKKSKFFVSPTRLSEGLPTVILESGLMGTPVLSTSNGAAKEVIVHNKTGVIIKKVTKEDILESLNYAVRNRLLMKQTAANLKTLVYNRYTWEEIVALNKSVFLR